MINHTGRYRWYGIYHLVRRFRWLPFFYIKGYRCLSHSASFTTSAAWHDHLLKKHRGVKV